MNKLSSYTNTITNTDYSGSVVGGWYPSFQNLLPQSAPSKAWLIDRIMQRIFASPSQVPSSSKTKTSSSSTLSWWVNNGDPTIIGSQISPSYNLQEQVRQLLSVPDESYQDTMLNSDLRKYLLEVEKDFLSAMQDYKSHIAPSNRKISASSVEISGIFGKTYYVQNYPSYTDFLWTRDVLNFYGKWDATWFIYPSDESTIAGMMKRRATQLKAEMSDNLNKWITIDADLEIEYRDVETIRQKITTKEERYFQTSMYITLYHTDSWKLNEESKKLEQKITGFGLRVKPATQRMDQWFTSTLPVAVDDLGIVRSAITTSLAGSFPFVSSDLIDDSGILYGVNLHTGWLIIYDRFSGKLPNANSVILATSGAGKSFTVKLEIVRYLLHNIDVLVIDPENEYAPLVDKVWGTYINIAINSNQFINPFDLPPRIEDVDYGPWDLLRSQILWLLGLISTLVWWITPEEEALLDKALQSTYALKWITFDLDDYSNLTPPLMQDLMQVLEGMEWWEKLSLRVAKYVTGTFAKLFNNYTNVDLDSWLTVFSIRDLEESLKTPAMFNILNYIWAKVRSHKRKRLLVVDEAWIMMQNDVSAEFLYGIIKRARKYWLWVTTITQDVDDFLKSNYGKPIITNSALQILLKQSTASIKSLESVFGLSEAEKEKLVSSNIGEWLIFAWNQHVAVKILASEYEKMFVSTTISS